MNRKMSYQNAGSGGWNSGLPTMWAMEEEVDSRNFKIALLVAIMIHILLLWVVFPAGSSPVNHGKTKIEKSKVRIIFKAPDEPLPDIILKQHVRLIPVPDQDPDGPEPMVSIKVIAEQDMPVGDFFIDDRVPLPDKINAYAKGLINPVYEMAQLQRNVVYPPLAVRAGLEGYVIVQAVLNRDATVSDVHVIGGNLSGFGFPEAARDAVKKLEFKPGIFSGHPVNVVMNLTIHFRLRR
ncbi:MAG: TonB family protein [Acidobacteria bacterium]|nr:TonB family protein [Acidobacteriota bacterium]